MEGEHESLCAMKSRLGQGRISTTVGYEPATLLGSANRSATEKLQRFGVVIVFGLRPFDTV